MAATYTNVDLLQSSNFYKTSSCFSPPFYACSTPHNLYSAIIVCRRPTESSKRSSQVQQTSKEEKGALTADTVCRIYGVELPRID
ncbi:hypothetical protein BDN70DRAFT_883376 [Pholiota conissans]|uniref:Uncharacterized protein n=1 Tax=Pholiota conissans TaxID=109636 RepID=A0A9P6CQD3_9AGAR|nr:hypothetical protein BDN70DRAFT_883376 [Pholiota conissans]